MDIDELEVIFKIKSNGSLVSADTNDGIIENILCLDDLDKYRSNIIGKTIYSKHMFLNNYDSEYNAMSFVQVPISEPLKVIDLKITERPKENPIWIYFKRANNEICFLPIYLNAINNPYCTTIDYYISRTKLIDIPKELNVIISIGMTASKVKSLIGQPNNINSTMLSNVVHEQWVYSQHSLYLYFNNNILESMQY